MQELTYRYLSRTLPLALLPTAMGKAGQEAS